MTQELTVRVSPRAAKTRVGDYEETADGERVLRVYVSVPPEDGKANKAVIEALAEHFDVARSRVAIIRGDTARIKRVRITTP